MIILVAPIVIIAYWLGKQTKSPRQVACTIDAKICPDGTSVGRIGPNCEFAPCPIVKEPIITTTPTIPADWKTYSNNFFGFSIMRQSKIKQLVWDYKISPSEFIKILNGENEKGWPNQDWAITRVLEHMNYYDLHL